MNTTTCMDMSEMTDFLVCSGFSASGRAGHFCSEDLDVTCDGAWLCARRSNTELSVDPLFDASEMPGLWKWISVGGNQYGSVFDLPLVVLPGDDGVCEPEDDSTSGMCMRWIRSTSSGRIREGWSTPAPEHLDLLLPAQDRTFRVGSKTLQLRVYCENEVCRLRCTLQDSLSSDLHAARIHALYQILIEVQSRLRLVRITCERKAGSSIDIVVDLTGAPPDVFDALVTIGASAIRQAAQELVEVVNTVADPSIELDVVQQVGEEKWSHKQEVS